MLALFVWVVTHKMPVPVQCSPGDLPRSLLPGHELRGLGLSSLLAGPQPQPLPCLQIQCWLLVRCLTNKFVELRSSPVHSYHSIDLYSNTKDLGQNLNKSLSELDNLSVHLFIISLSVPASVSIASELLLQEDGDVSGDNQVTTEQERAPRSWDQDKAIFQKKMKRIGFRVSEMTPADGDCGIHAALGK